MGTMKAAIVSDVHDNYHNLTLCLIQLRKYELDKIFFLGDFMNAGIALTLAQYEVPTFAIWGNNDGDRAAVTKVALSEKSSLAVGFATYDIVKWGGRKLFLTHYPLIVKAMAKSGDFDAVFYGHNHLARLDHEGECLILNPGEISAHKTGGASFAMYDSDTNSAEIIPVEGGTVTVLSDEVREFRKTIKFDIQ